MSEIYNCWKCKHFSNLDALCKKRSISCGAADPICEEFEPIAGHVTKKKISASSRIALIATEIQWVKLDPGCHDRMVYDSLSTIEIMLKHLSTSIKNTERDFEMEVVTHE